jgi:NTP pyrophosphatase (non-canonical NTP hydrolase)
MSGEVGELSGSIEKWIYYGQPLDVLNIKEEIGDLLWYVNQLCSVLHLDLGQIMEANIAKLRQRYPQKFEEVLAKEENRDRAAEAECVACSTGGNMNCSEEVTESGSDFIKHQMLNKPRTALCPHCGGHLNRQACNRAAEGGRSVACPDCLKSFSVKEIRYA